MAQPRRQDPFALWRDQQRQEQPLPDNHERGITLTPERHAIRALKLDELLDARDRDDHDAFHRLSYELVDLNRKLALEQLADDALAPSDGRARASVLHVAAAILQEQRPANAAPDVATTADTAIAVLNATARNLEAA